MHTVSVGYNPDDARGELLVNALLRRNLVLLNSADCLPLCESGNKEGRPDHSICTQYQFKYFDSWLEFPYLFRDHYSIVTSLMFDIPKRRYRRKNVPMKKCTIVNRNFFSGIQINFRSIISVLEMDREIIHSKT